MVRDNEDMTIADMKQPTVKTSCDSDDIPDVSVGVFLQIRLYKAIIILLFLFR